MTINIFATSAPSNEFRSGCNGPMDLTKTGECNTPQIVENSQCFSIGRTANWTNVEVSGTTSSGKASCMDRRVRRLG